MWLVWLTKEGLLQWKGRRIRPVLINGASEAWTLKFEKTRRGTYIERTVMRCYTGFRVLRYTGGKKEEWWRSSHHWSSLRDGRYARPGWHGTFMDVLDMCSDEKMTTGSIEIYWQRICRRQMREIDLYGQLGRVTIFYDSWPRSEDSEDRGKLRRRIRVADPSSEGYTAWRREKDFWPH